MVAKHTIPEHHEVLALLAALEGPAIGLHGVVVVIALVGGGGLPKDEARIAKDKHTVGRAIAVDKIVHAIIVIARRVLVGVTTYDGHGGTRKELQGIEPNGGEKVAVGLKAVGILHIERVLRRKRLQRGEENN